MANFNADALFADLPTEAEQQRWHKAVSIFDALPDEGQEAKGSFIPEAGKAIAAGTVGGVATALKGAGARQEVSRADRAQMFQTAVDAITQIRDGKDPTKVFGSMSDPDAQTWVQTYLDQTTDEQRDNVLEGVKKLTTIHPARDARESPLYKAGAAVQNWTDQQFKAAKDYEGSITQMFGQGLGSMGVFMAASAINPVLGLDTGVSMSAGEGVDKAIQKGATKEQILQVANLGFAPGITEAAPLEILYNKVPFGKWGKLTDALIRVGMEAMAEGGQEGVQQVMQNVIAKYVYDPKQDLTEDVAKSAAVGAMVGGAAATAVSPFHYGHGYEKVPDEARDRPPILTADSADTLIPPEGQPPAGGAPGAPTATPPAAPGAPTTTGTPETGPPVIGGVTLVPESEAPPAPVLPPSSVKPRMIVNDPEFTSSTGEKFPAGNLNGQLVTVEEPGDAMSLVVAADGTKARIGNNLLTPAPATVPPVTSPERATATVGGMPPLPPPPSDRLTPADRASPIPDAIIDAGKTAIEEATGEPSTITTTTVIDGKREVIHPKVETIVAADKAKTQAVVSQIMEGVATPEIVAAAQPAAAPAATAEVPATVTPAEAPASVAPPVAETAAPRREHEHFREFDPENDHPHLKEMNDLTDWVNKLSDADYAAVSKEHGGPDAIDRDIRNYSDTAQLKDMFESAIGRKEAPAPAAPKTPLADQITKLKARSAALDSDVADLTSGGTSLRMVSNRDPTRKIVVGPDMSEPGNFRITYFDEHGPSGHTVHNTMEEAVRSVAGSYHQEGNIPRQVVRRDVAVTPGGREVPVTYAVVEAADLVTSQRDEGGANPAYPQELQPRDRSRGTSDVQISNIANKLDPRLLDNVTSATDGAPIISADGVVESGNGRVLGIRKAYNESLPGAQAYRDYLVQQGYLDAHDAKNIKNPVLVRIRGGQMEKGERTAFTREANERTTMTMSATERAMADAAALSPDTVALYKGGDIADAGNRNFVRSFMQSVVSPNEHGAMVTPDGELSQEAIRRVQSALLAKAFGDADLVGALVESTDTNVKAIGGAMMDVAGLWSQMREESKDGTISPDVDVTDHLLEAIKLVQRARNEGRPLAEYVVQTDIFSGTTIAPEAEMLLRLMFRNNASWTQPAGREKLAEALRFYATEARKTAPGIDLLGETAAPAQKILETAKARQYGQEQTQEKLALGGRTAGKDNGAPAEGRTVEAKPGPKPEGGAAVSREAPAQKSKLAEKVESKRKAKTEKSVFPAEFSQKGAAGDFVYGYLATPGQRNNWQVRRKDTGAVVRGSFDNLNAVSNYARRMQEEAKAAEPSFSKAGPTKVTLPGGQEALLEHPDPETFRLTVDGKRVGEMNLTLKRSAPYATSVTVTGPRRIGVATAMYDAAEKVLGRRLIPSPLGLSPDAIAFWKNRLGKMEPDEKQAILAEALKVGQEAGVPKSARERVDALGYQEVKAFDPEAVKRKLDTPKIRAAIAAMNAVKRTDLQEGYGTDEWWDNRVYNFGTKDKPVHIRGADEAVELLVERARNLAVDELNEDRAKNGEEPLDRFTPSKDRRAIIVIGPPAAGKSTIANALALRTKSAIADVDDAKKVIPEYQGGIGANAVHEESSDLGGDVLHSLATSGDNIIIPKVGHKLDSIDKLRQDLKNFGYSVELVLMDVPPQTAVDRMIGRFENTGRLINPDYFLEVVDRPPATYEQAKEEGNFDGYTRIHSENNVPTRVSETTGEAQSVALGERIERSGEIRSGGLDQGRGPAYNVAPVSKGPSQEVDRSFQQEPFNPEGGRKFSIPVQGGAVSFALSDQMAEKADAIWADLRKALDKLGLTGVKLNVWQEMFANVDGEAFGLHGMYMQKVIDVALSEDPDTILHHEAIHALVHLGLLNESEMAILNRKSKKDWVTPEIKERYDESQWVEEGIARAYTDWLQGHRTDGMIARSFKKIKTFLKALYQTLTNHDIRSSDDVFRQITSGEIGRRSQKAQGRIEPTFAKAEPGAEGKPQLVIPGAEKITDAQLAQRKAEAPMSAKAAQKSVESLPLFGDQKDQLALFSKAPTGPNDPRFNLNIPPHTTQQAQQVTQGFLNRGQPVDRALRVPFQLLGGLDEQGRWRWGKRLSDKMGPAGRQGFGIGGVLGAGIGSAVAGPPGAAVGFFAGGTAGAYILGASPNPQGKFGWFAGLAEHAKRGLVDGYGLDPAYVEAYRKSEQGKAAILRQAQGIMKVLSNAGVGTQESKVLQAILSGDPVNDADMTRLSVPIRKAIDDMGAEAVSLGLVSAESFERNRGAYLHRVYTKNEIDQNTLAGWVSAKMGARRKKIIGDQLKGRGMFMDIETDRLMQDVESFQSGKRGAPQLGEKFRVLDEVSSTASLTPGQTAKEKTLRRVYLPESEAVPAKYQGPNWVDRGTWEVRKQGKQQTLWRDYTKAERDTMGELIDARYTIAKTFMLMANDLSTGRFFKEVSEKEEWTASMQPPDGQWKEASEYNQHWNDPEIRWVKVPDTNISDTGGKKRWGALAGKFVRSEIWRDLNEVDIANRPGVWRTLLTQWKKNKTARNPVVHMNNVMSNVVFMDLADIRTQDLVAGLKSFAKGDALYQEAVDNGAFGSDMVSQEIRDQVLKPILEEITKQGTNARNPFLAKAGMAGVIADKLWTWAKAADNGMLRAYQAEDAIFRMATYMRRRSQGESPKQAAETARDQFLNYDIRAPWVRAMRNTLFPFISYTYRAVPKLAENIAHRPWKLAKYAAIAYAVNALAYLWDDGDDGEDKERAALRDEEQGFTWLGSPRMLRMPWRDGGGLPVFLDIRRWIPAGDIFDTNQGSSAMPIPAPLHFGGPLQLAFEFMLNKQAFTGEDITNDLTQTNAEKFTTVADWAWKSWAPAAFWTPNSFYWTRISNALHGATDAAGHPYSVAQAFLSSIGVKVKPVDVEDGIKWHFFDFQQTQKALKKDLRSAASQLERGLISQSAYDSTAATIMQKFETLGQKIDDLSKRTEGKQKP